MVAPIAGLDVVDEDAGVRHVAVVSSVHVDTVDVFVEGDHDAMEMVVLGLDVVEAKGADEVADAVGVLVGSPQPGRRHARNETGGEEGGVPVNDTADDVVALLGEVDDDVSGEKISVPERKPVIVLAVESALPGHLGEDASAMVELDVVHSLGVATVKERHETTTESIFDHLRKGEAGVLLDGKDASTIGSRGVVNGRKHIVEVGHAKGLDCDDTIRVVKLGDLASSDDMTSARHGDAKLGGVPLSKGDSDVHTLGVGDGEEDLVQGLTREAVQDHVGGMDGVLLGMVVRDKLGGLRVGGIVVEPLQNANVADQDGAVVGVAALELVELDGVAQDVLARLVVGVNDVNGNDSID